MARYEWRITLKGTFEASSHEEAKEKIRHLLGKSPNENEYAILQANEDMK